MRKKKGSRLVWLPGEALRGAIKLLLLMSKEKEGINNVEGHVSERNSGHRKNH